jgi:5-methyltetrahydropteroyltriglutamate--homocysteine methyltransferase
MSKGLWTTAVGSYPKSPALQAARNKLARGEMTPQQLQEMEQEATAAWIRFQDQLGMDVLVDGEQYRGDMATYFAENMDGFSISGLVRSYGNRYYRKPVAIGPVGRREPITIKWFKYAQSLTSKPVKGMLTGPYTIADWSFNEHYPTFEAFVLDLARSLHEEAVELEKAGAGYIQIDEPAVSVRAEELELAIKALGIVTQGLTAHTITHICFGDFAAIYPEMLRLPVDQIDLEMANSNYDLLNLFKKHKFTKCIGLGVLDVHSHVIETKEQVIGGIKKTVRLISPERIYVDPDCGLKTRTEEEAKAKLKVMVEAVREVKAELGLE